METDPSPIEHWRPWTVKVLLADILVFETIYVVWPGVRFNGWTLAWIGLNALLLRSAWHRGRLAMWTLATLGASALLGIIFVSDASASLRMVVGIDSGLRFTLPLLPATRSWLRRSPKIERRGPPRGLVRLTIALVALATLVVSCGVIAGFMSGPNTPP